MVRSTSKPLSPCISFRVENVGSSMPAGTARQTVTGGEYPAVVVMSNAGQVAQSVKPSGGVPAEEGSIGVKVVAPAGATQVKLTVASSLGAVLEQTEEVGVGVGVGNGVGVGVGVGVAVGVGVGVGSAASLSIIVSAAVLRIPSDALPVGELSARLTVSFPSKSLSSVIAIVKVFDVSPGRKFSVREVAV